MSYQLQAQIKNNSNDIKNYIQDLYQWEESVNNQKQVKTKSIIDEKYVQELNLKIIQIPPVRGRVEISTQQKIKQQKLKRDSNSIQDYYKSWSQFDIVNKSIIQFQKDKLVEDEGEEIFQPKNLNEIQNTLGEENQKMVIRGGASQRRINQTQSNVIKLKDDGNLKFKLGEYREAIVLYTDGIRLLQNCNSLNQDEQEILVILYSNRAQCFINLGEFLEGESDCSAALRINQSHLKSLQRRATIYLKQSKLREALLDLTAAAAQDVTFKIQVQDIEKKLQTQKRKAKESLKLKQIDKDLYKTLRTVKVQDIRDTKQTEEQQPQQNDNQIQPEIQNQIKMENLSLDEKNQVRFGAVSFIPVKQNNYLQNAKSIIKTQLKYTQCDSKEMIKQGSLSYDYKKLVQEKIDGRVLEAESSHRQYLDQIYNEETQLESLD